MKVLHRQKLFHTFLKPFTTGFGLKFRAVPVPAGDKGVDHLPLLGADLSQLVEMIPKDISHFPARSLPLEF
jgi:hypothetical protein